MFDYLWNRFPTICHRNHSLPYLFNSWSICVIKSIQLRQGVLSIAVSDTRPGTRTQRERSIELNLGEGCTVSKFHSRQLMDFLNPVYPERADQICDLIVELLDAHARVRWINFNLLDSPSVSLQDRGASHVLVDLTSGTAERASGQKQVAFGLGEGSLDRSFGDESGAA
jgi:hypothetical protein